MSTYAVIGAEPLLTLVRTACHKPVWLCTFRTVEVACACSTYGDVIPGPVLNDRIASYVHLFNLYWYARWVARVGLFSLAML